MFYDKELEFLKKVLKNLNIGFHVLVCGETPIKNLDGGIREYLKLEDDYERFFGCLVDELSERTIYKITDGFCCRYVAAVLPKTEKPAVFVAGPYTNEEATELIVEESAKNFSVPQALLPQLVKYYGNLPCVANENVFMSLFIGLGETMWGSIDDFTVETELKHLLPQLVREGIDNFKAKNEDSLLSIKILEERYDVERKFMQAVSQGMTHKAEQLISSVSGAVFEKRTEDPIRNLKNYLIITNTLLRKAAENGFVHPFYIDGLSTEFAKKIEKIKSPAESAELMREMTRKYCALVKRHSMKAYSLLVQKVLTVIDSDLTADLSLRRMAVLMNVNASYLSALFKKETGKPLTEYVTQKRMEQAAYLLKSTSMQVQSVAQQCGIFDVNYFAKMFKKYTGKTPKEFREEN